MWRQLSQAWRLSGLSRRLGGNEAARRAERDRDFTVTLLCDPGKPMLALVDDEGLAQRKDRRASRPSSARPSY